MPDAATTKVIGHLREANHAFGIALAGPVSDPGPPGQLVARLGMFGFRQVEAIITLAEASESLHLQVSQLVRSLLEAWFRAAWVVAPDDEEAKLRRTIGLVKSGLVQYRAKIAYNDKFLGPSDPTYLAVLGEREAETAQMEEAHGIEMPPTVQTGMEELGRPDRYMIYRWESDAVHVSTAGLGQLADQSLEGVTVLGVAGTTDQWVARMVATWDTACDLYEIVTRQLGVKMERWEEIRKKAQDDLLPL